MKTPQNWRFCSFSKAKTDNKTVAFSQNTDRNRHRVLKTSNQHNTDFYCSSTSGRNMKIVVLPRGVLHEDTFSLELHEEFTATQVLEDQVQLLASLKCIDQVHNERMLQQDTSFTCMPLQHAEAST